MGNIEIKILIFFLSLSMKNTYDCGTQPIAKPTKPRNRSNQPKLGANELKNPYKNKSIPQSVKAYHKIFKKQKKFNQNTALMVFT